ncbi:hypothetical protein A3D62_00445 [Candidatus Kaiserbacteria bacterium RIFCSPHIGHO2_02_FULL_49_11]|uniref:Uncharacterized protein n=1 Tax=Candidatus Kaiserbacteria bacterium RIFCSPHIGHO2_02_FULL_49_11 TaxID=1798489 RepID=A0A1F6CYZ0_9BACT|nr:MAG: hypothetical protein A3D62_00445 [Candidatus Kaiserbacteria bacterium RIFCSPHIGHO2_02_FULL_49_11]
MHMLDIIWNFDTLVNRLEDGKASIREERKVWWKMALFWRTGRQSAVRLNTLPTTFFVEFSRSQKTPLCFAELKTRQL